MSVTAPAGFTAAGVAAGIKPGGVPDVALVVADPGSVAAAVFTVSRAPAAPVVLSRSHLAGGPATRAVIINSGCANAATGARGDAAAVAMADIVAADVGCRPSEVLVCSTGPIGTHLPLDLVESGAHDAAVALAATAEAGESAAMAIMTTDTVTKQSTVAADGYIVGGMAKGAGMIRPDMATMIAVLTTDAIVEPAALATALRTAVDATFHGLDVDGCPSTNDTVILIASGRSGFSPGPDDLAARLTDVCADLAWQIAADAEGATRVVTLEIEGAADDRTARRLGRAVADSALVRAAFYGGDPNWGRIVAALGATNEDYAPDRVAIWFSGTKVAAGGTGLGIDDTALAADIAKGDFAVRIDLGVGEGRATVLTTDLTPEYAIFNGERS